MRRFCCQRISKNLNDFFPKKCVLNEFTSLKKIRSSKLKTNFLSTTIKNAIKMLLHMIKRTIVFKTDRFDSYVFYLRCYRNDQSVFQKSENDPSLIPTLWNYLNIIILCGTPRAGRHSQGTIVLSGERTEFLRTMPLFPKKEQTHRTFFFKYWNYI